MSAKHTPGPWAVKGEEQSVCVVSKSGLITLIARTHGDWANARLIAAAPELLEVAQLILRGYGVTFQDAALRGLLAEAVAKATGEKA